jgi:hypothetical protein
MCFLYIGSGTYTSGMKSPIFSFRLEPSEASRFKEICKQQGVTAASILHAAIDAFIRQADEEPVRTLQLPENEDASMDEHMDRIETLAAQPGGYKLGTGEDDEEIFLLVDARSTLKARTA